MKVPHDEVEDAKAKLRAAGWLSQCPAPFQDSILAQSQWLLVEPSLPIARGGDVVGGMFGIAKGEVGLVPAFSTPDAGLIHIDSSPFWFGIQPFLTGKGRQVTAVARTPCLVAHVTQSTLTSILQQHPEGWRFLLTQSVAQTGIAIQAMGDLLLADRFRRCGAVLLRLAGARNPNATPRDIHCSHDELAAMCNLSRSSLSGVLTLFETQGLTENGYRNLRILDSDRMREMVDAS